LRNCPYINVAEMIIMDIKEASIVVYIGKSIYRINTTFDGRQSNNQIIHYCGD
jgi:hypothetical protein